MGSFKQQEPQEFIHILERHHIAIDTLLDTLSNVAELTDTPKLGQLVSGVQKIDINAVLDGQLKAINQGLPEIFASLNFQGLDETINVINTLDGVNFAQVLDGDITTLVDAAPKLLRQFEFEQAADIVERSSDAIKQLNFKRILEGDLTSVLDATPMLLRSFSSSAILLSNNSSNPACSSASTSVSL